MTGKRRRDAACGPAPGRAAEPGKKPASKRGRRIAFITGTRAEYGLLKPVVEALEKRSTIESGFIVTGMHLKKQYGRTIRDIETDGFPVWARVPIYKKPGEDFAELTGALCTAAGGIGQAFKRKRPDIAVVLGDRLEAFAGASAAYYSRIVTAHFHGGEKSGRHMDDAVRHAITRLSHLHFPATEQSARRLKEMGEEPFRIRCFGAPGLDALRNLTPPPRATILKQLGFPPTSTRPLLIFLFHPETSRWKEAGSHASLSLELLLEEKAHILAVYPNGDPGSSAVIDTLKRFSPRIAVQQHLPRERFLNALAAAGALIGNSSCGLIEAGFLGTPVLHLGERNKGREHGANILFRPIEKEAIREGLSRVLKKSFKERAQKAPCPWGDGRTGIKAAQTLARISLTEKLRAKKITL